MYDSIGLTGKVGCECTIGVWRLLHCLDHGGCIAMVIFAVSKSYSNNDLIKLKMKINIDNNYCKLNA